MSQKILILNLTRMGDLIQTSPLVRGLKTKYPDCHITMLANVKFAGIAKFIDGIDRLDMFDVRQFDTTGAGEVDALAVYNYLDELAEALRARQFDILINLSHSKLSAMLARLIEPKDTRGFSSTARGDRLILDPWIIYFTSFLGFRRYNRFNIVDLYMKSSGISPGDNTRLNLRPDAESENTVHKQMKELGIRDDDLLVGMQAGSSREDRRWGAQNFARVADRLVIEHGAKTILLGAEGEKELTREVETAMTSPAINLAGSTSLGQLTQWVKRLNLLVTNDTGTMHISAAMGTPIVALFFAHARVEETGPYTQGAMILQAGIDCAPCSHQEPCAHLSCFQYITPDDVVAVCQTALEGKQTLPDNPELFGNSRVYRSRFHTDGGVEFAPLTKIPLNKHELFAYLYRPVFNETLPKWDCPDQITTDGSVAGKTIEDIRKRFAITDGQNAQKWITRALEGAEELAKLSEQGYKAVGKAVDAGIEADMERLTKAGKKLESLDRRIAILADTHDAVSPLVLVYRRRVECFEGDDPALLAGQAARAHKWLNMSARLVANVAGDALNSLISNGKFGYHVGSKEVK